MRIITVRIEDNNNKINEIKELENEKNKMIETISKEIDMLQEEGFLQILLYIKCVYEDYLMIVCNNNALNISNIGRTVTIHVNHEGIFIDFNYMGSLNCINTPKRMKAIFKDGNIIITESTKNGIKDLMNEWKYIKTIFQEMIDKAYESRKKEIKNKIDEYKYLLKIAKEFKV